MHSLYKLIRESGATIGTLSLILFLATISSLLAVLPPHFLGAAINSIIETGSGNQEGMLSPIGFLNNWLNWSAASFNMPPIALFLLMFFLFNLIYMLVRNIFAVYVCIFTDKFILYVRRKCFARIFRGEKTDLERFDSGDMVHRVMSDTKQLDFIIGNPLYTLFSDVLDLLWISAIIIMINWKMMLILTSIIPLLYFISRKTASLQRKYAVAIQKNEASCTGFMQRSIMGVDTVKAYQGEQREITDFSDLTEENFAVRKKANINLGIFFPQAGILQVIGTIGAIAYAAFLATKDVTYIGTIPVLLVYTTKFYAPLGNWTRYYQNIQQGLVSYKRLQEILSIREEQISPSPPARLKETLPLKIHGSIVMESGNTVPLCMDVDGPDLIILKGKSGVGKTRLIMSLVGLGLEFKGVLQPGEMELKNHQDMRNHIAIATQDPHFIPGSLAQNLCYPETRIDEVKCLEILKALRLDYGLDHPVSEYGRNLSLGEQRRVIFGRALYSDKPIMILDEIDANVDEDTRAQLYRIIRQEMTRKVIIMTSHIHTSELKKDGGSTLTIVQQAV